MTETSRVDPANSNTRNEKQINLSEMDDFHPLYNYATSCCGPITVHSGVLDYDQIELISLAHVPDVSEVCRGRRGRRILNHFEARQQYTCSNKSLIAKHQRIAGRIQFIITMMVRNVKPLLTRTSPILGR
jgi:hypothetical protein